MIRSIGRSMIGRTLDGSAMRKLLYHFINGIRSGIPLCCTWYFVCASKHMTAVARETAIKRGGSLKCGYVTCDRCYHNGRRVKIKHNGVILMRIL